MAEEITVTCPACNTTFDLTLMSYKLFCPECSIPLFYHEGKILTEDPFEIKDKATKEASELVRKKEEQPVEVVYKKAKIVRIEGTCEICSQDLSMENPEYKCSNCGITFCKECPSTHTPPADTTLEVKINYRYRFYQSTNWFVDAHRFTDNLKSPLCSTCYELEFNKSIARIKENVREWKAMLQRDEEIKVISEEYPKLIKPQDIAKSLLDKIVRKE